MNSHSHLLVKKGKEQEFHMPDFMGGKTLPTHVGGACWGELIYIKIKINKMMHVPIGEMGWKPV